MSDVFSGESDTFGDHGGGGSGGTGVAVRAGSTIAAINAAGPKSDGDMAILRVGVHPNVEEVVLHWNSSASRWISDEVVLITQQDNWAMDLGNKNATSLLDWSKIDNPVPYGRAYARLTGAHDLTAAAFTPGTATGVITVNDTTSPHSYPFSNTGGSGAGNYLHLRDMIISYTGRTATTFTGCAVVEGPRSVVPDQEYIAQGYSSGWGFVTTPLNFVDQLFTAGLSLQERFTAMGASGFFFGAVPEVRMQTAPYWYQFNQSDGQPPPQREIPPTGGMGVSAVWRTLAGTGGGAPTDERNFYVTLNNWSDWPLVAPTKHSLLPVLVGKMEAGGVYSGCVLDAKLSVRWWANG